MSIIVGFIPEFKTVLYEFFFVGITKGFHSFPSEKEVVKVLGLYSCRGETNVVVTRCTIPKGSAYHTGQTWWYDTEFSGRVRKIAETDSIASDAIIIEEIIKTPSNTNTELVADLCTEPKAVEQTL